MRVTNKQVIVQVGCNDTFPTVKKEVNEPVVFSVNLRRLWTENPKNFSSILTRAASLVPSQDDELICDKICDGILCDAINCDHVLCDSICGTICGTICDSICDSIT